MCDNCMHKPICTIYIATGGVNNCEHHREERMETPFKNDPFSMVMIAYKRLYDKPCEIWWDYHDEDSHKEEYGFTHQPNDGSTPTVIIYSDHPVEIQVETLAHELAHVAVGAEHKHDEVWEEAFAAIHTEFGKIGDEMFGGADMRGTEDGNNML